MTAQIAITPVHVARPARRERMQVYVHVTPTDAEVLVDTRTTERHRAVAEMDLLALDPELAWPAREHEPSRSQAV